MLGRCLVVGLHTHYPKPPDPDAAQGCCSVLRVFAFLEENGNSHGWRLHFWEERVAQHLFYEHVLTASDSSVIGAQVRQVTTQPFDIEYKYLSY